jgi:hypothetical protein
MAAYLAKRLSARPADYRMPFGDDEDELTPDDGGRDVDIGAVQLVLSQQTADKSKRIRYSESEKRTLLRIIASARVCYMSAYDVHMTDPNPPLLQAAINELKMHLQLLPEDPMPPYAPFELVPFRLYSRIATNAAAV